MNDIILFYISTFFTQGSSFNVKTLISKEALHLQSYIILNKALQVNYNGTWENFKYTKIHVYITQVLSETTV